jgi:hypothetical protein
MMMMFSEGFYSIYHTNELKGELLNIAGTILIQIKYKETEIFIPVDEDTIIGEIHILVAKYIDI